MQSWTLGASGTDATRHKLSNPTHRTCRPCTAAQPPAAHAHAASSTYIMSANDTEQLHDVQQYSLKHQLLLAQQPVYLRAVTFRARSQQSSRSPGNNVFSSSRTWASARQRPSSVFSAPSVGAPKQSHTGGTRRCGRLILMVQSYSTPSCITNHPCFYTAVDFNSPLSSAVTYPGLPVLLALCQTQQLHATSTLCCSVTRLSPC